MENNSHADGYRFGIELEYRLTLRDSRNTYFDRPKVKDRLAKLWNDAGIGFEGHTSMKSGYSMGKAEDFKAWSVVDEHSMDGGKSFPTCECTAFIQAREYQKPIGPSFVAFQT